MEKANERIIYEGLLIYQKIRDEIKDYKDGYFRYHSQISDICTYMLGKINKAINFQGKTNEDFISYVGTLNLTPEHKKGITEVRRFATFKRIMGEESLKDKNELELLLGTEITVAGKTFADENGPRIATKTEEEIDQEFEAFDDRLAELLKDGVITEEQYNKYNQDLDYIYAYFISCSKGEQIPNRRISDKHYEELEQRAAYKGVKFEDELQEETQDLMYEHQELQKLQKLQSPGMKM